MPAPTILVTTATGRTGRVAVEYLRNSGAAVRAMAHREGRKPNAFGHSAQKL
jgi:NAD(P)H dehydrogenase (quinone)